MFVTSRRIKTCIGQCAFFGQTITLDFVRETLRDLIAVHDRQISLDNIQRMVADYFKIKISDLLSKRRNRSIARPRQVAMALCKELTDHSLPEIGEAFGGARSYDGSARVEKSGNYATLIWQCGMITATY